MGSLSLIVTIALWLFIRGKQLPLVTFGRLAIVLCGVIMTLVFVVLTLRTPGVAHKERILAIIGIGLAASAIVLEAATFLLHQ